MALAGIATVAFILAGTLVGVRLLRLSFRTEGDAERNIALGLLCVCAVGYPCGVVLPSEEIAEPVRRLLFVTAMTALAVGSIFIVFFVHGVFRKGEAWAALLARGFIAGWVILAGVSYWSALTAPVADLISVEGPSFLVRQGLLLLLYAWSSIESALYWEKMRRRCALGLAEPEVQNRFGLWSLASAASIVSVTAMTITGLVGRNPLEDPTTLSLVGISGIVSSGALVLAFLPPRSYLAWIRGKRA